jgi:hypothetical protein
VSIASRSGETLSSHTAGIAACRVAGQRASGRWRAMYASCLQLCLQYRLVALAVVKDFPHRAHGRSSGALRRASGRWRATYARCLQLCPQYRPFPHWAHGRSSRVGASRIWIPSARPTSARDMADGSKQVCRSLLCTVIDYCLGRLLSRRGPVITPTR